MKRSAVEKRVRALRCSGAMRYSGRGEREIRVDGTNAAARFVLRIRIIVIIIIMI